MWLEALGCTSVPCGPGQGSRQEGGAFNTAMVGASASRPPRPLHPRTHCPLQDVVAELGEPSSTHAKPCSAAGLGAPAASSAAASAPGAGGSLASPDFFFCYPALGLDVLFCGATHRLKKFVLHANAPGHPSFGLGYARCNFRCAGARRCRFATPAPALQQQQQHSLAHNQPACSRPAGCMPRAAGACPPAAAARRAAAASRRTALCLPLVAPRGRPA